MPIALLKTLLAEAERLHALSMDETLPEDDTDAFYAAFWDKAMEAAGIVADVAQIEADIAKKMIIHRRAYLLSLLERTA